MRDPNRIPQILSRLQAVWEKYPDLRLGQLIENTYGCVSRTGDEECCTGRCTYNIEDDEFVTKIEKLYADLPRRPNP